MSSSAKSNTKSNRSSTRSRRPTFSIVLLVAFIVAVFAFIGHRQVRSAEERRLRLLAGFADRIETTVPDLADRFRRIAARRCAEQVDDYLDLVPHLEHLSVQTFWRPCSDGDERPRGRESVDVHTEDGEVTARFCRAGDCDFTRGASDGVLEGQWVKAAEARIHLDEVLEPMIIPGIFDLVVIADRSGTVLHQQGEAALKVAHLDALLGHDREEGARADQESWTRRIAQEGSDAGRLLLRAVQGEGAGTLAGGAGDPGAATAIVETKIADADYSVFLQPVILAIEPEEGQPSPAPERWVAVGVISSEHLLSAGVTTSPILLFLLVSILPLGLIGWPFLKLALISRRQRFTRLDCAFLVLATVLALSFGALLLVDGLFMTRIQATVDDQLAELSRVIGRNFRMELLDARLQLGALNRAVKVDEDGSVQNAPDYFDYRRAHRGEDEDRLVERFIRDKVALFLDEHLESPQVYPYFDSVFWPDAKGDVEGATVPLRGHAVLPQNVEDREYVGCAREWRDPVTLDLGDRVPGEGPEGPTVLEEYKRIRCGAAADGADRQGVCAALESSRRKDEPLEVCLESLLDRTTGEAVAALSVPMPEWVWPSPLGDGEARRIPIHPVLPAIPEVLLPVSPAEERPVAALVTQLASLHHPVLPPEVQFAVVEPSGQVLFHSDSRRALTENFLEASDENRLLQALLQARREGRLTLHYWGRRHRGYLRPIPGLPWSLVVFRSVEDLRLRNFEVIYDFLNPFTLHLGVLALFTAAFRWIAPRRFRVYLWPSTQNLPAYRRLVWWTLGALLLFAALLMVDGLNPRWLFLASFLIAPVTFLYAVWVLPELHRAQEIHDADGNGGAPEQGSSWLLPLVWVADRGRSMKKALRKRLDRGTPSGGNAGDATGGVGGQEGGSGSTGATLAGWRRGRRRWLWCFGLLGVALVVTLLWSGVDAMAVWLLGLAGVTAACLWWFRSEFEGKRRRTAYTFALSCLLLVSVLPSLGFLELARARQTQLATQDTMVALARSLEHRPEEIAARRGPLPYYDHYTEELACMRDEYLWAVSRTEMLHPGLAGFPTCPGAGDGKVPQPGSPGTDNGEAVAENGAGQEPDRRLKPDGREAQDTEPPETREGEAWKWPYGFAAVGRELDTERSLRGLLEWLLEWIQRSAVRTLSARPVSLNDLSPQPVGADLSRFGSTAGSWERIAGESGGGDRILLEAHGRSGLETPLELASSLPRVDAFSDESFRRRLLFILGLVVLGTGPFLLARFIAGRLLLINLVYYGEKRREASARDGDSEPSRGNHVRPGESLRHVLEERGARIVIVAGELDRASWQDKVARGETRKGGADPEEPEVPKFYEAPFREAWEKACTPSRELRAGEPAAESGVDEPVPAAPEGPSARTIEERPHGAADSRTAEPEPGQAGPGQARYEPTHRAHSEASPADRKLSRRERFEAALTAGAASEHQPILITHFEPDTEDPEAAADQSAALQNLAEQGGRSVVILTDAVPVSGDGSQLSPEQEAARIRWLEVLGSFPVRYARDDSYLETFDRRIDRLQSWIHRKPVDSAEKKARAQHWLDILRTIEEDCEHTPTLRVLGHHLLTELFVDVKREMVKDTLSQLEHEAGELPGQLGEVRADLKKSKADLEELETELSAVVSGLRQSGLDERERERLSERQAELQARRRELRERKKSRLEERKRLNRRKKQIPREQKQQQARLKRVEERARRYSSDYSNLLTEDHVIGRIGAGARLHYRYLWSHCNRDEKLVLVQLAQQGLVNPKSFGWVLDLMHKGLVIRAPDLRLMNRSFRNFVLQEFRRSDALEWEEELGPNAWSVLKWILPFPILALAGFLFITQRDAVSNAAGVLVALASLTPVVFNLYGKFQEVNLRREQPEPPAQEG